MQLLIQHAHSRYAVGDIIYIENRFVFLGLFFFSFCTAVAALVNLYLITQKMETCFPYQVAKLQMLQDIEYIPLLQISLAII